jgi:hypothetical protein
MVKDKVFKRLLIPLLGVFIPLSSGLISFQNYSVVQLILSNLFFILVSFVIWQGSVRIVSYLRLHLQNGYTILGKLIVLSIATSLYGMAIIFLSCFLWQVIVLKQVDAPPVIRAAVIAGGAVIVLTLVYESIFLSTERELDAKVLAQVDRERLLAEVDVLRTELDPHFFFNSLNTLSHLVENDQEKAVQFIRKLANVYKYFLLNKEKDLVSLEEELDFLDNYYFLIRIRFDESVRINGISNPKKSEVSILPCTLQVLIENAIKHNFFSEKEPLLINMELEKNCLVVSNSIKPKLHSADSTKIGLKNLKARYQLIIGKEVVIESRHNRFWVKVPIVKQT